VLGVETAVFKVEAALFGVATALLILLEGVGRVTTWGAEGCASRTGVILFFSPPPFTPVSLFGEIGLSLKDDGFLGELAEGTVAGEIKPVVVGFPLAAARESGVSLIRDGTTLLLAGDVSLLERF